MGEKDQNKKFQITDQLINEIINLIDNNDNKKLRDSFNDLHHADNGMIIPARMPKIGINAPIIGSNSV
ncbi:MAG TPA: hypothetical protein QGI27_02465, partial [Flavobacteriaceae bacterium]|nr:hypothetical protein [Flavobacteriaceae bacterium]